MNNQNVKIINKERSGRGWIYTIECIECKENKRISKTAYDRGRKFCSEECYFKWNTEENHPSWGGGNYQYFKKVLRKKVLKRDNWTCQNKKCGLREPDIMEVDHIIPIFVDWKKIADINNLQTLCPNCHRKKSLKDWKKYQEKSY